MDAVGNSADLYNKLLADFENNDKKRFGDSEDANLFNDLLAGFENSDRKSISDSDDANLFNDFLAGIDNSDEESKLAKLVADPSSIVKLLDWRASSDEKALIMKVGGTVVSKLIEKLQQLQNL